MPEEFQRRLPSIFRRVADIKPVDMRISLIGTVIDKQDSVLVLDDGSGKININMDNAATESNQLVRVFGRVIPLENGFEVQGELLQIMDGLDSELHKKIESLWSKVI